MRMKLDARAVAGLALPEGKDEEIFWDVKLDGYGYRMRRSGTCVYVVQYRHAGEVDLHLSAE